MAIRIAFINGKGGCGKTTSLFHMAGVLSKAGRKVLAIDLDKQRNLTKTLLMDSEEPGQTVYDLLTGRYPAPWDDGAILGWARFRTRSNGEPKYCGVDVICGDIRLEGERRLSGTDGGAFGEDLTAFTEEKGYDYVLVDMPPSNKALNNICFRYLVDNIIVPYSSDEYSVAGYGDILDTVQAAREHNPGLNVLGIFLSRYMANCKVDRVVRDALLGFDTFIDIQIPHASDIREGRWFGRPISYYAVKSKSRTAFEALVGEVNKRAGGGRL